MKITKYKCDCCQKDTNEKDIAEVTIPLKCWDCNDTTLTVAKIDICTDCANRFAELYYSIAHEHFSSGLIGSC